MSAFTSKADIHAALFNDLVGNGKNADGMIQ
jgi:hypothetical protein